jgi:hypothetical protein
VICARSSTIRLLLVAAHRLAPCGEIRRVVAGLGEELLALAELLLAPLRRPLLLAQQPRGPLRPQSASHALIHRLLDRRLLARKRRRQSSNPLARLRMLLSSARLRSLEISHLEFQRPDQLALALLLALQLRNDAVVAPEPVPRTHQLPPIDLQALRQLRLILPRKRKLRLALRRFPSRTRAGDSAIRFQHRNGR